jgi:hypothetical protein
MAVKKTIELEAKVDKAQKDLDGVAKSVQRIDNNLEEVKDTTGGVAKGVKGIGNALKAAGIGLAIAAFSKLAEVFNENQKVADAFNTAFEVLSLAFNDFFKFLDSNVGTVIDYFKGIFENPIESIRNFRKAIYDGIIKRLEQGLEALGLFGKAAIKFFAGDFAGAAMTAKEASKELFDVVTGEDGGFEKITESVKTTVASITNYAKSTVEAARATVDLNKQAEVAAVINQGLIEKYDRQAEQQRQLRDDETKTIEERIAANNRLGEILDEQAEKMLENVDITIRAAQAEYDKNQNQENYIALLEAQNEREAVLAQIEGFRSEQISNRISLEREAADLVKEAQEEEAERINELLEKKIEASEKAKELKEQEVAAARALDAQTLDNLVSLLGEGTKAGKAAAVASATISGIESVQNAYKTASASPITTIFPAYPLVQAGIAAAFSAKQIQSILAVDEKGGGGSVSTPRGSGSQAPAFNVVGAAPENQLAQTLGEREERPVKAYVVGDDVTNQQALDRKITEGASIG